MAFSSLQSHQYTSRIKDTKMTRKGKSSVQVINIKKQQIFISVVLIKCIKYYTSRFPAVMFQLPMHIISNLLKLLSHPSVHAQKCYISPGMYKQYNHKHSNNSYERRIASYGTIARKSRHIWCTSLKNNKRKLIRSVVI